MVKLMGVKKSDLEEVIFDFEHKQYKSCVLVLFEYCFCEG